MSPCFNINLLWGQPSEKWGSIFMELFCTVCSVWSHVLKFTVHVAGSQTKNPGAFNDILIALFKMMCLTVFFLQVLEYWEWECIPYF